MPCVNSCKSSCDVVECVEPTFNLKDFVIKVYRKVFPEKFNPEKCNLYSHAVRELKAAGYYKEEPANEVGAGMNALMRDNILELVKVFSKQGHSGSSASFCINLFADLAKYKPLLPIQGTDDEWTDVSEYGSRKGTKVWQNNRAGHIFKEDDGKGAYDIDAVVYREPNGACYTKGGARTYITFPYTPTVTYIDVPFDEDTQQAEVPHLLLQVQHTPSELPK